MNVRDVQKSLYNLFKTNSIGYVFLQASAVLTLIYPIILVLGGIPFIGGFMGIFSMFGAVWFLAYLVGLIASFAKNDMTIISVAFALRAVDYVISIIRYAFSINLLLFAVLYAVLAILAFYQLNSSNN